MNYKLRISNIISNTDITKVKDDSVGLILNEIIGSSPKELFVHICKNEARGKEIESQLRFYNPKLNILNFPAWDCLPYDVSSPNSKISSRRIDVLSFLTSKIIDKTLIITTIDSLIQKISPVSRLQEANFSLKVSEEINLEKLTKRLQENGFQRTATADIAGEFAIRGSIIDIVIFKQDYKNSSQEVGYRLDFFGDNIESIRIFDPITQISSQKIEQINIFRIKEVVFNNNSIEIFKKNYRSKFSINKNDKIYNAIIDQRSISGIEHFMPLFYEEPLDNFFKYLQKHKCSITIENSCEKMKEEKLSQINEYYQARIDSAKLHLIDESIYNALPTKDLYLDNLEIENNLKQFLITRFDNFSNNYFNRILDLDFKIIPDFVLAGKANKKNPFTLFIDFIRAELLHKKIIIGCSSLSQIEKMKQILLTYEIESISLNHLKDLDKLPKNFIGLGMFLCQNGFYNEEIAIISQNSLLGSKQNVRRNKKPSLGVISENLGLETGELVVHRYHGIGKFMGLENIKTNSVNNDFLKLTYHGGDNLFLPVEDMNLISRYGSDNPLIQLDRLGGSSWKSRSEKIKKRIKVAAEELIKIAAIRKSKQAPILIPNLALYEEFKSSFEFIETADQINAIEEIEEDLCRGFPMDRLICGDVGFGKTEIAMRAAFIAANNESEPYQVAIVTPTTLLCRQHFINFQSRFKDTKLRIATISRMISPAKVKEIKTQLEEGKIDIIIGTHALLNKNIKFKNLGLAVIDEEQHFGVAQKEQLKKLKNEIHLLSLSATPIPRTLQMSLSGVKDLSLITTPPIDRIAIRSFVMDYDSVIIKEAIMREYHRGGKIFFVVPRIKDLEEIHPKLEKLVPNVKINIAHGQMSPSILDKIMNDFHDDKFQLLLATSIIESGIDIKNANTIIIHRANMFGLAQLYQLRGRVGRGKIRAYAYLTTPAKRKLNDTSVKKLQVMQTLDSLGAGFTLASHDMEIRGGGNILSEEQSGHIRETGVELYQSMLEDAIKNLKNTNNEEINQNLQKYQCQIKLKISLLIPDNYISDLSLRLSFYKRISNIKSTQDQDDLTAEIIDRFGIIPEALENLLKVAYLKHLCQKCNIEKLESKKDGILITFYKNHFDNPDSLIEMIFSSKNKIKLINQRVMFFKIINSSNERFNFCFDIINNLLEKLKK